MLTEVIYVKELQNFVLNWGVVSHKGGFSTKRKEVCTHVKVSFDTDFGFLILMKTLMEVVFRQTIYCIYTVYTVYCIQWAQNLVLTLTQHYVPISNSMLSEFKPPPPTFTRVNHHNYFLTGSDALTVAGQLGTNVGMVTGIAIRGWWLPVAPHNTFVLLRGREDRAWV